MRPVDPPRWTDQEFEGERQTSIAIFRDQRMLEPLDENVEAFERGRDAVETLLETTLDLTELLDRAVGVLSDKELLTAVRYLSGPPISADDLKTLAVDASLAPTSLRKDPEMARRVIEVVLLGLDRGRFPWLTEDREASESERYAAAIATAALLAHREMLTGRANESKTEQEQAVKDRLLATGFTEARSHPMPNLWDAPEKGTFCGESLLGTGKADIVVRLHDGRVMPIEAKVSNSSTNSVKRLNRDAAAKAAQWTREFGTTGIVPAAVLAGVFKLHNLRTAQDNDNLTIFWVHDLEPMVEFIAATRR